MLGSLLFKEEVPVNERLLGYLTRVILRALSILMTDYFLPIGPVACYELPVPFIIPVIKLIDFLLLAFKVLRRFSMR